MGEGEVGLAFNYLSVDRGCILARRFFFFLIN